MAIAVVSSEGSTGEVGRSASQLIHMAVSRPWLLIASWWTGAFGSLLVVI